MVVKPAPGTRVRVISNTEDKCYHYLKIGIEGKVIGANDSQSKLVRVQTPKMSQWVHPCDLEPVDEVPDDEASAWD